MRVKVLVLIKGLGLGGAERLLVDSLPFMNRARFDYHVGYLLPWKCFLVDELERAGIPVHCLGGPHAEDGAAHRGTRSWKSVTVLPRAWRRLRDLQRRERFDVIHADLPVAGILARLAGRQSSVPVVYTEHNLQERYHTITRWRMQRPTVGTIVWWRFRERSPRRSSAAGCSGAPMLWNCPTACQWSRCGRRRRWDAMFEPN